MTMSQSFAQRILILSIVAGAIFLALFLWQSSQKQTYANIAECLNTELKKYNPPPDIVTKLHQIFPNQNIFYELEQAPSPQHYLESLGFKVFQFKKYYDTVVVETDALPGWIIKFVRASAQEEIEKAKSQANIKKNHIKKRFRIPRISQRVVHAQQIEAIIKEGNYQYVRVPKKYFYCIGNIAFVISEKVISSERTLKDLTPEEITEILNLVAASKGMLDVNPKNMILTQHTIFFIDTERESTKNWWNFGGYKKAIPRFKQAINPAYVYLVDAWLQQLPKV